MIIRRGGTVFFGVCLAALAASALAAEGPQGVQKSVPLQRVGSTAVPCPAMPPSLYVSNPPSGWSGSIAVDKQTNAIVVGGSTNVIDCIYSGYVYLRRTMPTGTVCTANPDLKGFSCK